MTTTTAAARLQTTILAHIHRANRPMAWSEIRSAAAGRPYHEVRDAVDQLVAQGALARTTRHEPFRPGPRAPKLPLIEREYLALR